MTDPMPAEFRALAASHHLTGELLARLRVEAWRHLDRDVHELEPEEVADLVHRIEADTAEQRARLAAPTAVGDQLDAEFREDVQRALRIFRAMSEAEAAGLDTLEAHANGEDDPDAP